MHAGTVQRSDQHKQQGVSYAKKTSRNTGLYSDTTIPITHTRSNQISNRPKDQKCWTFICVCIHFLSSKNKQGIAPFRRRRCFYCCCTAPSPPLLLLLLLPLLLLLLPLLLLCCCAASFAVFLPQYCCFRSDIFFLYGRRNYTTRKRSWHNSKDHISHVCL